MSSRAPAMLSSRAPVMWSSRATARDLLERHRGRTAYDDIRREASLTLGMTKTTADRIGRIDRITAGGSRPSLRHPVHPANPAILFLVVSLFRVGSAGPGVRDLV